MNHKAVFDHKAVFLGYNKWIKENSVCGVFTKHYYEEKDGFFPNALKEWIDCGEAYKAYADWYHEPAIEAGRLKPGVYPDIPGIQLSSEVTNNANDNTNSEKLGKKSGKFSKKNSKQTEKSRKKKTPQSFPQKSTKHAEKSRKKAPHSFPQTSTKHAKKSRKDLTTAQLGIRLNEIISEESDQQSTDDSSSSVAISSESSESKKKHHCRACGKTGHNSRSCGKPLAKKSRKRQKTHPQHPQQTDKITPPPTPTINLIGEPMFIVQEDSSSDLEPLFGGSLHLNSIMADVHDAMQHSFVKKF